jgi:hypothetical protein
MPTLSEPCREAGRVFRKDLFTIQALILLFFTPISLNGDGVVFLRL